MTHYFRLDDEPFKKILNGSKTIELRLFDDKRKLINIGDKIVFSNNSNTITVIVKALHRFKDFEELYKNLDLLKCGYDKSNVANASYKDMLNYYSLEDINRYGVVGIEF